jgi:hypothetical protein
MKTCYRDISVCITRDGPEIRELLHGAHNQCGRMAIMCGRSCLFFLRIVEDDLFRLNGTDVCP